MQSFFNLQEKPSTATFHKHACNFLKGYAVCWTPGSNIVCAVPLNRLQPFSSSSMQQHLFCPTEASWFTVQGLLSLWHDRPSHWNPRRGSSKNGSGRRAPNSEGLFCGEVFSLAKRTHEGGQYQLEHIQLTHYVNLALDYCLISLKLNGCCLWHHWHHIDLLL